jgi:hypothetical protein
MTGELDPKEQWKQIHDAAPGYEVNWDGQFRALERVMGGRTYPAQPISKTVNNRGYEMVKYRDRNGERVTRTVHSTMLNTFLKDGIPEGHECRHWDDNSRNNTWRPGATEEESRRRGGNLFTGTKRQQHQDKVRNGGALPPPGPAYDCVNSERCGNKVHKEGRRCMPCVDDMGREAAQRLDRGENLVKVARSYGYEGTSWTLRQARLHGYTGSESQALSQGLERDPERRAWAQRVIDAARLRRRPEAASHAESPESRGKAATAPLRGVSPAGYPGQSRTSTTPNVAERDHSEPSREVPKVTDSNHYPYPADLVAKRDDRTRRGTGRSR